jgi:hypothetical protein
MTDRYPFDSTRANPQPATAEPAAALSKAGGERRRARVEAPHANVHGRHQPCGAGRGRPRARALRSVYAGCVAQEPVRRLRRHASA